MDDWAVTAEDVFLVDIGSQGYTAYEVDRGGFKAADIIELYESFPGLEDGSKKAHHVHSHHNMQAFMSGTDWSQMNDRGRLANYFIMLVVSIKSEWVAYVGFPATIEQKVRVEKGDQKIKFANNEDGYAPLDMSIDEGDRVKEDNKTRHIMVVMEMSIVKEAVDERPLDPFLQRYHRVVAAVVEASRTSYYPPTQYGGAERAGYVGTSDPAVGKPAPISPLSKRQQKRQQRKAKGQQEQTKGIMAMTEKDWVESQTELNGKKPYSFAERHVKALLNASIEYGFIDKARWNDTDPIHSMLQNYRTAGPTVFQEWVGEFIIEMRTWLDHNFPDATDEEYLDFVKQLHRYVTSFAYQPWAAALKPAIDDELTAAVDLCLEEYNERDGGSRIVDTRGVPFPVTSGPNYGGGIGGDFVSPVCKGSGRYPDGEELWEG